MPRSFVSEFYERKSEVQTYLLALRVADRKISQRRDRREQQFKIFKAGALLITYNVVEASARSSLEAIYDEIKNVGATLDELIPEFRRRVLLDFQRASSDATNAISSDVAIQIIESSFDIKKLFSGNVDARKIREKGEIYGFSTDVDGQRTRGGATLLTVKEKRNDLAHGLATFSEVGRLYTMQEVVEICEYSLAYIEEILKNIDKYLDDADYIST